MKKFLVAFLSFVLAFVCVCAAGCGEYNPANNGGNHGNKPGGDDPNRPKVTFTARLTVEGKEYIPQTPMSASWSDGESVFSADFDENGVATVEGLDGDYAVSLSGVPQGYTYNPNIYFADNDNKDISIELIKLNTYFGSGTGWYGGDVVAFTSRGVYRLTFDSAGQEIKCRFTTTENGNYVIESIVDTGPNEYNPRIDVYSGSAVYVPPEPTVTITDGGNSSVYTQNFRYDVSTEGKGGSAMFAVKCASRHNIYPAYVDIRIVWASEYDVEVQSYTTVFPKEDFKQTPEYSGSTFVYIGDYTHRAGSCTCPNSCPCWQGRDCTNEDCTGCTSIMLSGKNVGYSDPVNGGDGYYHLLNEDGSISEKILYAKIGTNRLINFFDGQVNLKIGNKNYIYMIRGYSMGTAPDDIGYLGWVGGEDKIPEEDKPYLENLQYKSYVDYVNSDGVYAVTQELKDFLQAFSIRSAYFMDGLGYAESQGMQSTYYDQWLFGCGYYI